MSARAAAALRRCRDALQRGVAPAEVARFLDAEADALEHRPRTIGLAARVARLKRQGLSVAVICERLSISRSGCYKLLALSPRTQVDTGTV